MKHLVVYLSFALILLADCLVAQIPIEVKKHHLCVDVSFSLKGKSYTVPAIIDTGASYCVIDSTFAVDLTNPQTKEIETAHLGKPLRKESFVFYSQQMGKVGKYPFTSDFFVSKAEDFARLNADIFFGHIFILDYKAKRLIVLE